MTLLRDVTSHVLDCGTRFYIVFRGRMVLREFRDRSEAHRKLGSLLSGCRAELTTTQEETT